MASSLYRRRPAQPISAPVREFIHLRRRPDRLHQSEYYVEGRDEQQERAEVQYTVHKFELSEADNQSLSMDVMHVPTPFFNAHQRHRFSLPREQQIVYVSI